MEQKSGKGALVRLIVLLVILAAVVGVGVGTGLVPSVGDAFAGVGFEPAKLLDLAVMLLLVLAAENLLQLLLHLPKPKRHRTRTVLSLISSALRYVAAIVILCWGLAILGVQIGAIVAGVGVLALIVGFGAEKLIADVVTGFFMLIENKYNVGDYVEVGGFRGKVTAIGIRTTSIEDGGGNIKIVNNSDMTNLLNRSDLSSRAVCTIGIPYETDLEALEAKLPAVLDALYAAHGDVLLSRPSYLGVEELGDSAVVLKFVAEVQDKDIFSGMRILNHDIFLAFRRLGVECPFPQVDVHNK